MQISITPYTSDFPAVRSDSPFSFWPLSLNSCGKQHNTFIDTLLHFKSWLWLSRAGIVLSSKYIFLQWIILHICLFIYFLFGIPYILKAALPRHIWFRLSFMGKFAFKHGKSLLVSKCRQCSWRHNMNYFASALLELVFWVLHILFIISGPVSVEIVCNFPHRVPVIMLWPLSGQCFFSLPISPWKKNPNQFFLQCRKDPELEKKRDMYTSTRICGIAPSNLEQNRT